MIDDSETRYRKKAPRHKKYGIQQWSNWFKKWTFSTWYVTEKARDQALADLKRHTRNLDEQKTDSHNRFRKIDRQPKAKAKKKP